MLHTVLLRPYLSPHLFNTRATAEEYANEQRKPLPREERAVEKERCQVQLGAVPSSSLQPFPIKAGEERRLRHQNFIRTPP